MKNLDEVDNLEQHLEELDNVECLVKVPHMQEDLKELDNAHA